MSSFTPAGLGWGWGLIQHSVRSQADRGDDVLVAGASAEVAGQGTPDQLAGRIRLVAEKGFHGHQNPGRAKATLESMALVKRLLQRMQRVFSRRHTFDGRYAMAVGLDCEEQTGSDGPAVELDSAGAAHSVLTSQVRPGQACLVAYEIGQQKARFDRSSDDPAVNLD
jgi:hypothetical protein